MSDKLNGKPAHRIDLAVDVAREWAIYRGRKIFLRNRPTYLKMLKLLSEVYPDPVPTSTLIKQIWCDRSVGENNVYNTRKRLSERLRPFGLAIITEPNGQGFRLIDLEQPTTSLARADTGERILGGARSAGTDDITDAGKYIPASPNPLSLAHGASGERSQWSDFVASAAKPSPDALRFAEHHNGSDRRIIGPVIELFRHRHLESSLPLEALGWKPEEILMINDGSIDTSSIESDPRVRRAFEASEEARIAQGKGTALQGDNNPKFAVSDISTPFHDVSTLTILFKQTDYFSVLRTRPAVADNAEVRFEFGSLTPRDNLIPGAAGIQFATLFTDGQILTILRDSNTFPWPNTWSFSGEEQVDRIDFLWETQDRMKFTLLRTIQEEIFPLGRIYEKNQLLKAMQMAARYVSGMRVWSVFLEEPTATFSVFCVINLACTVDDYRKAVIEMVTRGLGEMSNEGKYFAVPLCDTPGLLQGQTLEATQVFGAHRVSVHPDRLHPTSRYRLLRLLEAAHNAPAP